MKKLALLSVLALLSNVLLIAQVKKDPKRNNDYQIDLSGEWLFQADPHDEGVEHQWFNDRLKDKINLPGSMTSNGKGNDIGVHTPWTGGIVDSSWFFKPEYAKYRKPRNIKVPF